MTHQKDQVRTDAPAPSIDGPAQPLEAIALSPAGAAPSTAAPPIPVAEVIELLTAVEKAIRARRLYQANNPVYQGFIKAVQESFARLWDDVPQLSVRVEEHGFRWYDQTFVVGQGRESLSLLFFKDGVRLLTFLPGFEEEVEAFLGVIAQAKHADQHGEDDVVTLLWQQEFDSFQYSYVDTLAEGVELPAALPADARAAQALPPGEVGRDAGAGDPASQSPAVQEGQPTVASSITREDFDETIYFLDPKELDALRALVDLEIARDIRTDVLHALFDRLEDPVPDRQLEILRILRQLLPAYLVQGDLTSASRILTELAAQLRRDVLAEREREEAAGLFRELSDPEVLTQLFRALEEGSIDVSSEQLGIFLAHLGPAALGFLVQRAETTVHPQLRDRLAASLEKLGAKYPNEVLALLGSDNAALAAGGARLAGRLVLHAAVQPLLALLAHRDVEVRRAAVDALIRLGSNMAMDGLRRALGDADRDVRIAAVRGLAGLRYTPARAWLAEAVQSKTLRGSDLTEQIAFFEAFGAVASAENVDLLDKLLNGRRLLGKEPPELRACAAMALGALATPAAMASLRKAAQDTHPMVRTAVTKALKAETS